MLVVTRRQSEKVHIQGGITIQVVRIEDDRVRIGITAPKTTVILRDELFDSPEKLAEFLGHPCGDYRPRDYSKELDNGTENR